VICDIGDRASREVYAGGEGFANGAFASCVLDHREMRTAASAWQNVGPDHPRPSRCC
jgi:hypothetical protein